VDFSFTEEQQLLRNSLRSFLDDHHSFDQRRAALNDSEGRIPGLWRSLARDIGVLSMAFPEHAGGLNAGPVSTMVVMEELGRSLVTEPYLETIVLCGGLLSRLDGLRARELLSRIGAGEVIACVASGESGSRHNFSAVSTQAEAVASGWRLRGAKSVVIGGPWAQQFLVSARTSGHAGGRGGISLFLVPKSAAGVVCIDYPTIDGRRASDVRFDDVMLAADALIGEEGDALEELEFTGDAAIAAISAEAVGVLTTLLQDTISYTQQRRQFGQPIANFQALQHRMVDMYLHVEMTQSAAYLATLKLSAAPRERALAAAAAKVTVANACRFVGQNAVQLHGGMGMTDELRVSHYFKRATVLENEFGSADFHLSRHAALSRANHT